MLPQFEPAASEVALGEEGLREGRSISSVEWIWKKPTRAGQSTNRNPNGGFGVAETSTPPGPPQPPRPRRLRTSDLVRPDHQTHHPRS